MSERTGYGQIARELRGTRPRIASRLTLSFILACACAAAGLLGAWGYSMLVPEMVTFPTSAPSVTVVAPGANARISTSAPAVTVAAAAVRWYRVRDETVGVAFAIMGFVWLWLLWRLWRPVERGRAAIGTILFTLAMANVVFAAAALCEFSFIRRQYQDELILGVPLVLAIIAAIAAWVRLYQRSSWRVSGMFRETVTTRVALSGGLVAGTTGLSLLMDRAVRMDEEIAIAAMICAGVGGLLLIWLPVIFTSETRMVRGETGHVDVRCPVCGYSLIGLRELRCPECGEQFVLDDLLARQGFLAADDSIETAGGRTREP